MYPYKQYTVAQGGDGGMEYAMMTLITGGRSFKSLFGVTCHELAHSWFQHVLATNETKHEWMDEGFTTFISTLAEDKILEENKGFPMERRYNDYYRLALSGTEMPQSTNANRYEYNYAYENTAYDKGAVFLSQLGYIREKTCCLKLFKNTSMNGNSGIQDLTIFVVLPKEFRNTASMVSNRLDTNNQRIRL